MPKYRIRGTGEQVELNKGNFKAKGGEGAIHIIGGTVYKVCDSGKMIPDGKLQELAILNHKRIIKPDAVILDSRDHPVGYTMRLVPGNAVPLAQILTKTYREREGVTPKQMTDLVQQIAEGLRFIHKHPGYLQVDGNELNYMVTDTYEDVYFIDVNSFQTPHYPADAIMASIRDYQCPVDSSGWPKWSQTTDWYSFAIISFFMFTGIHPFKGRHPRFPDVKTAMIDQMTAGISVLDADTKFPQAAVYFPFESVIPGGKDGAYMRWYRAIFCENKRLPAPADFQAVLGVLIPIIKEVGGSNNFDITLFKDYADKILGFYASGGKEVVVTSQQVYVNNQPHLRPAPRFRIGFTPVLNTPVAAWLENEIVKIKNLETQADLPIDLKGKDIMACEGRLYVQGLKDIFEITFFEKGGAILVAPKSIAGIMPNATQLFQGLAIQDMFGSYILSIFPKIGHHRQVPVKELNGLRITEAKYEDNVAMILAADERGQYARFVLRFSANWDSYDLLKVENINPSGLNFTVLDNGICICLTEDEKIQIFSNLSTAPAIKVVSDPAIKADMHLCHTGSQTRFALGEKLYSISMRK